MRRVADPGKGARWNKHHPPLKDDERISVAETHEEHLTACYPSAWADMERVKAATVPASFRVRPGHVTGMELAQLGVPGICRKCGELADNPNPNCRDHPDCVGGGRSEPLVA